MIDNPLELAVGAGGGATLVTVLVRAFISKALKDLSESVHEIGKIKTELASITVKLKELDTTHQIVRDLDRKIVALETRINNGGHDNGRSHGYKGYKR